MAYKGAGRPKTNRPTRSKSITLKLTENELHRLKEVCYDNRLAYIDVLLKGLEHWSK